MALDKLVDSTKLDACLDAEADAIRAKTGGSADIPFDYANNKGFADAIAAIPSGGGGLTKIAEYTHAENWTTDALGNAQNFRDTYIPTQLEYGVYIAEILNNTQSGVYAQQMVITNFSGGYSYGYPRRYTNIGANISTGASFYVIAGATIKVYFAAEGVTA